MRVSKVVIHEKIVKNCYPGTLDKYHCMLDCFPPETKRKRSDCGHHYCGKCLKDFYVFNKLMRKLIKQIKKGE